MKRSEFVTEVLNDFSNTVFTTKEQVEVALELFEKLGMLPPETKATPSDFSNTGFTQEFLDEHNFSVSKWESEDEE
jgi:hypothetical protein